MFFGNNSYYRQDSQLKFFKKEAKVSLTSSGFSYVYISVELPSTKNNPHDQVAHAGETCSEPFQWKGLV